MALLDQAVSAAKGLAKQKLPPEASAAFNVGSSLKNRMLNGPGVATAPKFSPGLKDPLAAARARHDPLMNFNWWCDMPILNGSTSLDWSSVEEAILPFVGFDQIDNYRAGKNYHFPQHYSIGNLQLKFYEDSEGTVANYLNTWQGLIMNRRTGLFYFPKDFKKTITIWVLDVARITVMSFEYSGCWPLTLDTYNLGSSQSERVIAGTEFSVDELNIKVGKFESTDIPSLMSQIGSDFPPKLSALPDVFPSNYVNLKFV